MSQASHGLEAWTLRVYVKFEQAIAAAVTERFTDLVPGDPRPLLVGALTMAAVRISLDAWLAGDGQGDLGAMLQDALGTVVIS